MILIVTDPCTNMHVYLHNGSLSSGVPEYAIAKYPNLRPTLDNNAYVSYDWGFQNKTISAWDPNFLGGYICGEDGASLCQYVIGVYGYCAAEQTQMTYTLEVNLNPASAIYSVPQTAQKVKAQGVNSYRFCVRNDEDVSAQVLSWTDSCECPTSYTNLQMVVSRTNPEASMSDIVWRLEEDTSKDNEIVLYRTDGDTRPGACEYDSE